MNFNMNIRTIFITSAFLAAATSAFAQGQDTVAQQQTSLLQKLDSLDASVLGLRINGTVKAGGLSSKAHFSSVNPDGPKQENEAYTDANLRFTARPSSETKVDVQVRLHKDWQNAYDENNNPVIGHWFSYDGSIFNKHVDFNLGYMRVGYTPLTIFTPQPELLQEPEIFAQKRVESLAQRNLDTTSNRLMQGLNVVYNSGEIGAVDNIMVQATGARMRNTAKKADQVFFDFDYSDRYLYGGRLGLEAFGARLGVNYVDVFDRKLTRRTHAITKDTVYYEDNSVFSGELGFDSKKLLGNLPVSFGVNGEFALSGWEADRDYMKLEDKTTYSMGQTYLFHEDGSKDSLVYVYSMMVKENGLVNESYGDDDGKSIRIEPYINADVAGLEVSLKAQYLKTDKEFWSEMASTPTYRGGSVILNSNALYGSSADSMVMADFGSASLENMYFSIYNSNSLNATNLMTSGSKNVLTDKSENTSYFYSRLYNNYKNGHFYRNGYSAAVLKRLEMSDALLALDPSVDLAMPYGAATPDRNGFNLKLDVKWNDAITLNGRFTMMTQEDDPIGGDENKFTEMGAGLGVDFGTLLGLDRVLLLQGSYTYGEEDAFLHRNSGRVIAGATLDVWGPIALLGGYQAYERNMGNGGLWVNENAAITKATESLLLGGVRVKLAPASYLSLQAGRLNNEVAYKWFGEGAATKNKLSIDKNVVVADVTVNF